MYYVKVTEAVTFLLRHVKLGQFLLLNFTKTHTRGTAKSLLN